MLSLIAKFLPSVLPFLGKLGRGKATILGDVGAVVSAAVGLGASHIVTDQNLVPLVHEIAIVAIAFFQMIASFGFGRRANAAAATP